MKKTKGLMSKRSKIIPNERRRQTWRKHRLNLIDRRSKLFYSQPDCNDEAGNSNANAETASPGLPSTSKSD